MQTLFFRPPLVAVLIAVFFALFTAESGSASFRRFRVFNENSAFVASVCMDGITVGFSNATQGPGRKVQIFQPNTEELLYEEELQTEWVDFINQPPPEDELEPFCRGLRDLGNSITAVLPVNMCSGPHYVQPPAPLAVGSTIDVVFLQATGTVWENMDDSCREAENKNCGALPLVVSDCKLKSNWITLVQTTPNSSAASVTDSLVFEASALDPDVPAEPEQGSAIVNGSGINAVVLDVIDPFGNSVHSRTDSTPPYCLFGETDTGFCQAWIFADHDYTWPSGRPLAPGPHRLRASVDGYYSNDETMEWAIDVQRTFWQELRYLPYIQAHASLPGSMRR